MRILIKFNISIKKKRTNVMYYMGIDMGTSTVKIVLVKDKVITGRYIARHYGKILACVVKGIREICSTNGIGDEEQINVTVTGSNSHLLTQVCPESGLLILTVFHSSQSMNIVQVEQVLSLKIRCQDLDLI